MKKEESLDDEMTNEDDNNTIEDSEEAVKTHASTRKTLQESRPIRLPAPNNKKQIKKK